MVVTSGSSDRTIKLWNTSDGTVIRDFVLPSSQPAVTTVATTPFAYPFAHPGWVYSVHFTNDGKFLVSAGNAPENRGFLAVWGVADGKLQFGQEFPLGPFFSVAVSPDGKLMALACGPRNRQSPEANAYVLKMPELDKKGIAEVRK